MERNLLISRPDNRTYVDENGNFRPAFHIIERDSYTPIEDGYQDTVFVREMDEAGILERVQAAIDYAREQGIPVQVNHIMVRASIGNARVDARGIEIVPGPGDEANAPEWSGPEWVTARISRSRWEADHAWQEKNPGGRRIAIWHPKRDTVELVRHSGPGDLVTDGIELYPYPDLLQRSILAQMPGPGDDEVRIGLEWVE